MKLQQMSKGGKSIFITLPKQIIKGFGWIKGDKIKHKITGEGKIELSKE